MIKNIELTAETTVINFNALGTDPYFYASNKYCWVKNTGSSVIGASSADSDSVSVGSDECCRLTVPPDNSITLTGTGSAVLVTGDDAACPFKSAAKGGDSVSLALLFDGDIPTSSGNYSEFTVSADCTALIIVPLVEISGAASLGSSTIIPLGYIEETEKSFSVTGYPNNNSRSSTLYIKRDGNAFYIRGSTVNCGHITVYGI